MQKHEQEESGNARLKQCVKKKNTEESAGDSASSNDEFVCHVVRHLKQVKKVMTDGKDKTLTVHIEDTSVKVEPDSVAEINFMDKIQNSNQAEESEL